MKKKKTQQTIQTQHLRSKLRQLRNQVLKPSPSLTLVEWADTFRYLSASNSSRPGRWQTSLVACAFEPMQAVSNPKVRKVTIVGPTQLLKTSLLENTIGYYIHQKPSPILVVTPREQDADMWATERLDRLIEATPVLNEIIKDKRERDSGNTKLIKLFPGGQLAVVSSRSPASLASRPIRVLLFDEIDKFPISSGDEGDPLSIAEKRLTTFFDSKSIAVCSPTLEGQSKIWRRYEEGSRHVFNAKCPHCDALQRLEWENVKWQKDDPDTAQLYCVYCHLPWSELQRLQAIGNSTYIAENPSETEHLSFHVNALASPFTTPAKLAKEFLQAKKAGANELQVFVNTSLALCWSNSADKVDWETVYNRRESYPMSHPPSDVAFITVGCDTQNDRLEATVIGWTKQKQAYVLNHYVIHGPTHTDEPWEKLKKEILENSYNGIPVSRTFIDSGGHNTSKVYEFVSQFHPDKVSAIKGSDGFKYYAKASNPLDQDKTKATLYQHKLWIVGSSFVKTHVYGLLKLEDRNADSYLHFPELSEEYFKSVCSEEMKLKNNKWIWEKVFTRNEALDCLVYAYAAAVTFGLLRFSDQDWSFLRGEIKPQVIPQPTQQNATRPNQPFKSQPRNPNLGSSRQGFRR